MEKSAESNSYEEVRTAICLSGGGMRSAAFCIGVLQALRQGMRPGEEFHYMSTVSGGGFAGAWYRVIKKRNRASLDAAVKDLRERGAYLDPPRWHGLRGTAGLAFTFLAKMLAFWLFAIPAVWTALLVLAGIGQLAVIPFSRVPELPAYALAIMAFLAVLGLQIGAIRYAAAWVAGIFIASVAANYLVFSNVDQYQAAVFAIVGIVVAGGFTGASRSNYVSNLRWIAKGLGVARVVRIAAWLSIVVATVACAWALVAVVPLLDFWFEFVASYPLIGELRRPLSLAFVTGAAAAFVGLWPADYFLPARNYRKRIRRGFGLSDETRLDDECFLGRPVLLINTASSIDENTHRQWDERKAESFTWVSCKAKVNLGVAIATSAAVVGPRMGSYTVRPVGLLLSFFNARLGQWFRDPYDGPEGSIGGLALAEIAPRFIRKKPAWKHLTDGGHFDNLGLYEAVRRRCTHILVVDAGRDPQYRFSDLANAIRKIRRDQAGTQVEVDGLRWSEEGSLLHDPSRGRRQRVYGGTVRYPQDVAPSDTLGKLVYVKATVIGDEPADVAGYGDLHPDFPHESTTDQWFSESQFESYRRLGEYTIEAALQHYADAKLTLPDKQRSARTVVNQLREVGMIAGRPELRPTHGGAIVLHKCGGEFRFLLVQATGGGCWVLPKGHVERGESPFECAKRELLEEAGIEWPHGAEPLGIVFDKFSKAERDVRCLYYLRQIPEHPRETERSIEDRALLWVSPEDYDSGLRQHLSFVAEAPTDTEDPAAVIARSREPIRGLSWLLHEARRLAREHDDGSH